MKINPFSTIKDYSEMLDRIGMFNLGASLLIIYFLRKNVTEVNEFLAKLPGDIDKWGLKIPLATFLAAFLVSILSRVFKLHNLVSDILKTRHRYDINNILIPYCNELSITIDNDLRTKIEKNRNDLMSKTFYKYASSKLETPVIDKHLIEMVLDQWSWFWTIIEIMVVLFISALFYIIFTAWNPLIYTGAVLVVFAIMLPGIYSKCQTYTKDEVNVILSEQTRRNEIREAFNAL